MTNNNQSYERPELQVLFVETENGFAQSKTPNSPANGYSWDDNYEEL